MLNNGVMVNSKLKEIAEAKGYKNAKRLADAMSEHFGTRLSYRSIYALWDNTADLYARGTLNRICQFLSIPLGMLIVYEGDPQTEPGPVKSDATGRRSSGSSAKSKRASKQARAAVTIG
jgi:DNA-binding Xre family transcriptional regulator